jgi:hypothetical protein
VVHSRRDQLGVAQILNPTPAPRSRHSLRQPGDSSRDVSRPPPVRLPLPSPVPPLMCIYIYINISYRNATRVGHLLGREGGSVQ